MLPYGNTLDRLARASSEPKLLSSERIRADTVAHLSADDRNQSTGDNLGRGSGTGSGTGRQLPSAIPRQETAGLRGRAEAPGLRYPAGGQRPLRRRNRLSH